MVHISIRTVLFILHLISMVWALGAATVADLLITRSILQNRISKAQFTYLVATTRLVVGGLIALGITGAGIIVYYKLKNPLILSSPRLWAKYSIVAVIAVNGWVMHHWLFPALQHNLDRPLLSAPGIQRRSLLLFSCGAISFLSWYSALVLGMWPEVNFTSSYAGLMAGYGALLGAALPGTLLAGALLRKHSDAVSRLLDSRTEVILVDPLTGAPNARAILDMLGKETRRSERYGHPLSLLFLDIHQLDTHNRSLGESVGNELLKKIVDRLSQGLRDTDYFGRFGGDELVFILPHTDAAGAEIAASRFSNLLGGAPFDLSGVTGRRRDSAIRVRSKVGWLQIGAGYRDISPHEMILEAERRACQLPIDRAHVRMLAAV